MSQEEQTRSSISNEAEAAKPAESTEAAATNAESARTVSLDDLERELEEVRSKASTYLDLAQRTQADFVNYKRRVEQERSDYARSARADVILKILPVVDDLERAVESLPPNLASSDWVQGIVLIDRKLRSALEGLGVKRIEAVGKPFDPWQEEAVAHEPSAISPAETVIRTVRNGYTLDGRVIRPAQVIVSSGPAEKAE